VRPSEIAFVVIPSLFLISMLFFYFLQWRKDKIFDKEVWSRGTSVFLGQFFRQWWMWLTHPVEKAILGLKITPNQVTGLSIVISFFSGLSYAIGHFPLGGWLLFLAGFFDLLDGRIARRKNMVTKDGAFFDSFSDRVAEGIVYMGIIYYFRNSKFWLMVAVLTMLSSQLISYAKARAEALGVECAVGWMQRPERIIYLAGVSTIEPILYHIINKPLGLGNYFFFKIVLLFLCLMAGVTVYQRAIHTINSLRNK
jgi:CDP-diacylglycerol--glycerol-3-phosphate 3-phosphatidyltransferase